MHRRKQSPFDRFIYGSARNEHYDLWHRKLNTDAAINEPKPSFGEDYNEALRTVSDCGEVSFSLKRRQRFEDNCSAKLDKYIFDRQASIPKEPVSILDAPGLRDDYYLNVLDWSVQGIMSVALNESVYLWNSLDSSVNLLTQASNPCDYISSLCFSSDGHRLHLANSQGCLSTIDMCRNERICDHYIRDSGRIGCMTVSPAAAMDGDFCLSVGTKRGTVYHFDPRQPPGQPAAVLQEHTLEVCGLRRGFDGHQLASGGNDNLVCVWDLRSPGEPLWVQNDHLAAVRALDWCPWSRNRLVTGAGTSDRRIRFWNTSSGSCTKEIQCESQVCGLRWSTRTEELVSTHGFGSNELIVWHYPSLRRVFSVPAHESRVLQLTMSPDGTTVVTAAANEHLKFWSIFSP